jgi:drug/metabolite transporter (DMT)-like permease
MNKGVLLALLAYFFFCCADAIIKSLGQSASVFEIGFFISLFALVPILAFTAWRGEFHSLFRINQPRLVFARAATGIMAGMFIFHAFANLPFAETYALAFLSPMFATILSIIFLAEDVRWRRWSAVAIGLIGVFVVVRPGFRELEWAHLAAILAALMSASTLVILRKIGNTENSHSLLGTLLSSSVVVNGILMAGAVDWPTADEWLRYFVCGLFAAAGQASMLAAARLTQANVIAPAQYTQMIWAIIFGAVFFSEFPDVWTIAGLCLIAFAGLLTLLRDEKRGKWLSRTPVSPDL